MNPTIPRATRFAATAAAALLTLSGLAACSDDSQDSAASSQDSGDSSASSDQPDAPGTDQSKAVFNAYTEREPIGSTTKDGIKFQVLEVKATDNLTDLVFQMTGSEDASLSVEDDIAGYRWTNFPTLSRKGSTTALQPLTVTRPGLEDPDETICLCSAQSFISEAPRTQHVLYQSLPDDATKVTVKFADFDPVTVKVTR